MLASSAVLDVLFWWLRNLGDPEPTWYSALWPYAALWMVLCRGAVVLARCKPRWWICVPALVIHCWAASYPARWPADWLEAEIHAVAFCCLMFGLALVSERRNAAVAVLFLGTAAAYYPAVWHPEIRGWLMYLQSACYLGIGFCEVPRSRA